MSDTFVSRWGIPELDSKRYINIPGFIIQHWAKFVSIQEWAFIIQVMSFKFDTANGQASPALETIQNELGYKNIRSVQTIKKALVKRELLHVEERDGFTTVYDFHPFTMKCREKYLANQNTPLNHNTGGGVNQDSGGGVNHNTPEEIEVKEQEDKDTEITTSPSVEGEVEKSPKKVPSWMKVQIGWMLQRHKFNQDIVETTIALSTLLEKELSALGKVATEQPRKQDIADVAQNHIETASRQNQSTEQPEKSLRNRIFDGVALLCFSLNPDNPKTSKVISKQKLGGRIGKIQNWLLEIDETPENLWEWGKWWDRKYPGTSKPRDITKFQEHYLAFKQEQSSSTIHTSSGQRFDNLTTPKPEDYAIPEGIEYA